jgi:hypothetical protein
MARSERVVRLEDASLAGNEIIASPYGLIQLAHAYPTDEASALLFDVMDAQRAAQAYLWGLPVVGFATWRAEQRRVYEAAQLGDFVVFDSLRERRGIVAASLGAPYVVGWVDLAEGPVVIDYPAAEASAVVLDFWQRPVTDLGPSGPDGGRGGRYVLVGPSHTPARFAMRDQAIVRPSTNAVFVGLRVPDAASPALGILGASLRMARLGDEPRPVRLIVGLDREWSATPPRGLEYWERLAEALADEPAAGIGPAVGAMLDPLGIAPGRRFAPDARQARILTEGAMLGELMARNLQVAPRHCRPYWAGTGWYADLAPAPDAGDGSAGGIDARAAWRYQSAASTRAATPRAPGTGQVVLTTTRGADGRHLRPDLTYRLRVPGPVPVAGSWSLTIYGEATRRLYPNGGQETRSVGLDGRDELLAVNRDGSIEIFVGPRVPAGHEHNWLRTGGEDGWFACLRLYAPMAPFFERTWAVPDFEVRGLG